MSDIKRVKVQHIIESQIPEFLNEDSPLFKEFLDRYYISQEHPTGIVDLASNLDQFKNIETYNDDRFFTAFYPSVLTQKLLAFDDTIYVSHTIGFPDKYGLIKIDDEIITYTSKTSNSFLGCFRGFSGVHDIRKALSVETINFSSTKVSEHISTFEINTVAANDQGFWDVILVSPANLSVGETVNFSNPSDPNDTILTGTVQNVTSSQVVHIFTTSDISDKTVLIKNIVVQNLSLVFYSELFKKFKAQFLPGFENRSFIPQVKIKNILSRANDFYTSKGTDTSYKILFNVLYGASISIIKPQEYLLRPSDNNYFITRNILVEQITNIDPELIRGRTLFQDLPSGQPASASIYSIEYRPFEDKDLYEIYLDSTSFINNFETTKKTNISKTVPFGSDNILVDSTIGFPQSGTLLVKNKNLSDPVVITYNDKTNNQFLDVSGVIIDLSFGDEIYEENFVYSYLDDGTKLEFRLINVIGEINYQNSSNLKVGDKIALSSFGSDLNDKPEFNSWVYNLPTSHNIKEISLSGDTTGNVWTIRLYDNVKFYIGESIELVNQDNPNDIVVTAKVKGILSGNLIQVLSNNNVSDKKILNKVIEFGSSDNNNLSTVNKIPINVQNTYVDEDNTYFYVASSGIPNYKIYSKKPKVNTFSSPGIGKTDILNTDIVHRFYTGEQVYYFAGPGSDVRTGIYHITAIGDIKDSKQVKLSLSKSDLYSKKYISFNKGINSDYFVKLDYENKDVQDQKILKKFSYVKGKNLLSEVSDRSTNNRKIGILGNGTELYSPTLFDENIYYGKLDSISVTDAGRDYDIINPPELEITDISGSGATGYLNIVGSLKDVRIISPGIGYQIKPKITLIGGNGSGAVVEPNLVKSQIISGFKGDGIGLNPTTDTFTFFDKHNFDDGEEVIYNANTNAEINPLKTNSTYFVGIVNDKQIRLYETITDAYEKTNQINIVGISSGFHYFKSVKAKNTITKLYVKNPGSGYSNRLIKIPSSLSFDNINNGVNTFDHYIFAKNHNFKNKDIIRYSTSGTEVAGLSTTSEYIVTVVDENKFKLSSIGSGQTIDESDYINKRYIKFTSLGSGDHTFYYPPIRLLVESLSGVGATTTIEPVFDPVVLGSIESVFLENTGVGYGVSDIINFHRRPDIRIKPIVSEALLKPIVVAGSIVDVQFLTYGGGYDEGIDIIVTGSGRFADIRPVVDENGRITAVNIANGGVGYEQNNTSLKVQRRGRDAKFLGNVFEWKINQVEKNKELLSTQDEGLIVPSKNKDLGLQFIHFHLPKIFRKSINDHIDSSNREVIDNTHSPIIGWSYDGNPIYGPYGQVGSEIRRLRSSYAKRIETNINLRPDFSEGFFEQDYYFDKAIGDLDEYNGRFCKTPEYPNGVYAYFCTIDGSINSKPEFPYIIGKNFRDYLIAENTIPAFNQNIDLTELNLIRNIGPYYINTKTSKYDLIESTDKKYKQEFIVTKTLASSVDEIQVYSPGINYKVGDNVIFNNEGTDGSGISAVVSRIRGKELQEIHVGISTFTGVKFHTEGNNVVGVCASPHGFSSGDDVVISAISDSRYSFFEGVKKIITSDKVVGLTSDLNILAITGETTYISVKDVTDFSASDYIGIGSEVLRITNVDQPNSRLLVNRLENTGFHTAGIESVRSLPNKFYFTERNISSFIKENKSVYFNPKNSIGFGTQGVNYTLPDLSNLNIPARRIYIPNHDFYTGQEVTYNVGVGGTGIIVSETPNIANSYLLNDNQTVYIINQGRDFIGISTLGFTTTTGIGSFGNGLYIYDDISVTGFSHSLTTKFPSVVGKVENYSLSVETTTNHELVTGEDINFNIFPQLTETIKFRYDSILRKVTTELLEFDTTVAVSTVTSHIYLPNNNFSTGDKVVYYNNGNGSIGGLVHNETYYVIKEDPDYLALANYYSDAIAGVAVTFTGQGSLTNSFALVNPLITITRGNTIKFDLSDPSLNGMDLKLYKDSKISIQVESYKYQRNGIEAGNANAQLSLDTRDNTFSNTLFYNLIPLSPIVPEKYQISFDTEVSGHNKIALQNSTINDSYKVVIVDNKNFKFNLKNKPEYFSYSANSGISSIYYDTDSKNSSGPISKIKLNFGGKKYKKVPKIVRIESQNGSGGVLKCVSSNIGKIDYIERVKDGFDYPTDKTLKPILSVPTVCQIRGISRIDTIDIISGGKGYNVAPRLKVIGNDNIRLSATIQGGSIVDVKIDSNSNDLTETLTVLPIKNSNGYDIDDITYNSGTDEVTLELVNSDNQLYPLISNEYGSSVIDFPFAVGDQIFIESCRINQDDTNSKENYNSSNYGYKFFTVTGINTTNFTVTYSVKGIGSNFGEYTSDFNYGYVTNKKNMASFNMKLIDDNFYNSGEDVIGYDSQGNTVFTAKVLEDGWDNDINQLRLIDSKGELEVGNRILGTRSRLNGIVESVNQFNLNSNLNVTREKLNDFGDRVGFLNDYQQRISDNKYYQKFSYSIKSQINYDTWKESVKSLVHPAGFREFSDLDVIEKASNNMRIGIGNSSLNILVNVDGSGSVYSRGNFSMVLEDEQLEDGSIERVIFPQGVDLKSYLLSKTNKVLIIDDISNQFSGFTTSIGGSIVGLSTFKLKNKGTPLFYREFSGLSSSTVDLTNNRFNLVNHNFQSGQKIFYGIGTTESTPIGTASTVVDIGFSYPPLPESFDSEILSVDSVDITMDTN
jgi:hypothetical protein